MNVINRQKFLAELGRLLTFMYEEDRLEALAMYNKMFDDAQDEQALLQYLVSPTRQAVVLARSYDAKERKLQVHSQSRSAEAYADGEVPDYVQAIDELQREAVSLGVIDHAEDADQISLFDDAPAQEEPAPVYEEPAPVYEEPAPVYEEPAPVYQEPAPVYEEPAPVYQEPAPVYQEPAPVYQEPAPEAAEPEETREPGDKVDAFLAGFSLADSELPPQPEAALPSLAETPEAPAAQPAAVAPAPPAAVAPAQPTAAPVQTRRKTNVALLILFIIFAVPLSLIGIVLLLVPTVLFLAMAVSAVSLGIMAISSAFAGGLSLIADTLALLGVALVLLALGLLFAWIFVWFIGGAIAGLIRGIFALGRKWCTKEVPVR